MLETQRSVSRKDPDLVPGGVVSPTTRTARLRASTGASPRVTGPPRAPACCITGFTCTKEASAGACTRNMATPSRGASTSILQWSSSLGPTSFVRLSWLVFAACGLGYFAVFLHVFRDHPRLAVAALLLKVFFFTNARRVRARARPRVPLDRELVLVAVPALCSRRRRAGQPAARGVPLAEARRGGGGVPAVLARGADVLPRRGPLHGAWHCCGATIDAVVDYAMSRKRPGPRPPRDPGRGNDRFRGPAG